MDPSRKGTYTFALLTVSAISLSLLMYILGDTNLRPMHTPWLPLAPTLNLLALTRRPETPPTDQGTPLTETETPGQTMPLRTSLRPAIDRTVAAQRGPSETPLAANSASPPACLPNGTKLLSAEAVLGASQVLAGEAGFLPPWAPLEESYLVMECNSGRVSERVPVQYSLPSCSNGEVQ